MAALGEVAGRPVVEIGPGRGILTAALLRAGAHVIGVELDERLADYLRARFAAATARERGAVGAEAAGEERGVAAGVPGRLEVLTADALELDLSALARERGVELPLAVVGNIPYGITSPLLRRLLAAPGELATAVLMVQREVAERLLAEPGTRAYGSLTVGVRAVADVRPVLTLSPARFRPPPKVWSTVVRIAPRPEGPSAGERVRLERLTKELFAGRRKQMGGLLRRAGLVEEGDLPALEARLGLPLSARPEELPVEAFRELLQFVSARGRRVI